MDREKPVASVVIPCRNHSRELGHCLRTLVTQRLDGGFEVIVIDSAADAKVVTVVKQHPTVRIARSTEGLLPGQARNLGARHARGTYLAFLDADCIPEPGWLAAAVAALKVGARIVGGPVLHGNPWHPVAVIDNLMQFSDMSPGRPQGIAKLLPSCNMAVARVDFEQLGGFPPVLLPAGEDVLFCNQAERHWGRQSLYVPGMRVRHFGRTGLRQLWGHQELFGFVRAAYGLELSVAQRRLGGLAIVIPAVGLKRLSYMVRRAAAWNRLSLAYMALLLPILLYGLAAWCYGFHRGCKRCADPQ
jgi:glycosyltransferase involved in cell wall biosynthesis